MASTGGVTTSRALKGLLCHSRPAFRLVTPLCGASPIPKTNIKVSQYSLHSKSFFILFIENNPSENICLACPNLPLTASKITSETASVSSAVVGGDKVHLLKFSTVLKYKFKLLVLYLSTFFSCQPILRVGYDSKKFVLKEEAVQRPGSSCF